MRRLLAAGANPRLSDGRETPLHAAARRGPLALVETLLACDALEWQTDAAGRTPLDVARRGRPREKSAIVALLDRRAIADPAFRAAVAAIHAGDTALLAQRIDAEPRLLRERIIEPEVYRTARRRQYFLDPKLFWFVANNPTLVERMPRNISDVAQVMIDRGVDGADLDYALELTMTSSVTRIQNVQRSLMRTLLAGGAIATRNAIVMAGGHCELDALQALLDVGEPMSAPIAGALGVDDALIDLVATADPADIQAAFGLAVINGHVNATGIALDAGADVNAPLPVHEHALALHQAALDNRVLLIQLLIARGAHANARDKLWDATPLEWAIHQGRSAARAALESYSRQGV